MSVLESLYQSAQGGVELVLVSFLCIAAVGLVVVGVSALATKAGF